MISKKTISVVAVLLTLFALCPALLAQQVFDGTVAGSQTYFQSSTTTLNSNWRGFGSAVTTYQVGAGLTPYSSNIVAFATYANTLSTASFSGLSLTQGTKYYTTVLGIKNAAITSIAGGANHSVALYSNGTVWAWGANNYGQLGDTTTIQRTTPVQVATGAGTYLSGIISIAGGAAHTVALRNDGTVWAWGYNNLGQLGIGTSDTSPHPTPVQVSGLSGITAIAGGAYYTIALKNDGTVWTWGDNSSGMLGDGTWIGKNSPVQVKGPGGSGFLAGITAIAGGDGHSGALKNDGTVWSWGGALGNGSSSPSNTPVQVKGPGGIGYLTGITAIAGGGSFAIALKNDGTVWDWGLNLDGELGNNSTTDSYTPVQVSGLSGITAIAGGEYHTIALKNDGTVWTWGYNAFGELGNNSTINSSVPVQVLGSGGIGYLTGIVAIAGGYYHTVALKNDGTVWTCGNNGTGQLGNGTTTDSSTPVQVTTFGATLSIATSNGVTVDTTPPIAGTVNITNSGGTTIYYQNYTNAIYTNWSGFSDPQSGISNYLVEVGTSPYTNNIVPLTLYSNASSSATFSGLSLTNGTTYYTTVQAINGVGGITAVAGGMYHTMAMKNDGTVWTWGLNGNGQLGNNTTTDSHVPVQVFGPGGVGFLTGIIATAGGNFHTIAMKNDGTVWTWGDNFYGQLGDNTTTQRNVPVQVNGPGGSGFLTGIIAVSGGGDYTVALKNDGTVWTWGYNGYGQLGDGTITNRTTPVQVKGPGGSGFLTGIIAVSGGGYHITALKNDGTVWTWGYNPYGQLGNNSTTNSYTPVQVMGSGGSGFLTNIIAIASGLDNLSTGAGSTIALKNDGSVWAWGYNGDGELGDTTTIQRNTPIQVATGAGVYLTGITAIAGGYQYTMALKNDGTVWTWGNNGLGQLGNGTTTSSITPIQVPGLNSVTAIASGRNGYTIALNSNGTIWAWGANFYGQLGDGTTIQRNSPVQIAAFGPTMVSSNGVTVDTNVPTGGTVSDNGGGTVFSAFQSSATYINASWANWGETPSGMLAGANTYQVGIVTSNGTQVVALTNYANGASSAAFTGLTLTSGTKYYVVFTATDAVGNTTSLIYSNGITIDTAPPVAGTVTINGGAAFQSSAAVINGVWANWSDALSGVATYSVGVIANDFNTGAYTAPLTTYANTATSASFTGLTLVSGTRYYLAVRATDNVGNVAALIYSSPVTVDTTPPIAGTVNDGTGADINFQSSTTTLSANWSGFSDPQSGISNYLVEVGTSPYTNNIVPATLYSNTSSSATFSGLSLTNGTTYYTTVQAINGVGGVIAIGGGYYFNTLLKSDGTVWTWGKNADGELGDGTTTNRSTPVQVSGLTGVVAISGGWDHVMALKNDGTVWTWGWNLYGQLGDGTTVSKSTPVQVSGLTNVIAIAAVGAHSIALKNDGTVWAWGANGNGQLGDGTTVDKSAPIQVPGLTGVIAIAGGENQTITLKNDGTVWAWGYNGYGQLGDNTFTQRTTPVQMKGPGGVGFLTGIVAISSREYHTVALKNDGTVWACGWNNYGQLGDGTTVSRITPVQVSGLINVIAISGAGHHTMALKNDGTVWTWGWNFQGQLGDGTFVDKTTPVQVSGLTNIIVISNSGHGSIALKNDGTVSTWGCNFYGELGNGTFTNSNIPVQVSGFSTTISFASSDGVTVDTSAPTTGAINDGTGADITYQSSTTTINANWSGFSDAISGVNIYRVGVVRTSDNAYIVPLTNYANTASSATFTGLTLTSGTNYYVQIVAIDSAGNTAILNSNGVTVDAAGPVAGSVTVNSGAAFQSSATTINAGWSGFSDLLSGISSYQVGVGTSAGATNVVALTTYANTASSATFTGLTLTAGTTYYVTVVAKDAVGNTTTVNSNGVTVDTTTPIAGTVNDGLGADINFQSSTTTLSANWSGFSDPTSGISNYLVEVGTAPYTNNIVPLKLYSNTSSSATFSGLSLTNGTRYYTTVQAINGVDGIIAIAGGYGYTVALKNDGTVWTWGFNPFGELGNNSTTDSSIPVQVSGLTGITAIAGGGGIRLHTIALKNDGTVWTWGYNFYGQLGDTTTIPRTTPVQVATGVGVYLSGITAIAGGGYHTIALKNDGTVWTWGANGSGQLGDNTIVVNKNTPVQVATGAGVYLSGIVAIAGGGNHTIALKNDGTVWAWGQNTFGQLGDTTAIQRTTPVQVATGAGVYLSGITAIAGGSAYTIALKNGGTVWAWGNNFYGQLGNNTNIGTSNPTPTPVQVSGLTGIVAITGGDWYTVALKSDGTVYAWGYNNYGQLGNYTTTNSSTPVKVVDPTGTTFLTGITAIAGGGYGGSGGGHTVALKNNGTVWAWGSDSNGQLGDGPNGIGLSNGQSSTPLQVVGFTSTAVTVSSNGVTVDATAPVAGTVNDGLGADINFQSSTTTLSANWSGFSDPTSGISNYLVEVGTAPYTNNIVPATLYSNASSSATFSGLSLTNGTRYYTTVQAFNGVSGTTAIAAGVSAKQTMALKSNGTVFAWGSNFAGELGDGTTTDRWNPVQASGLTNVIAIAGGGGHTIALKSDGTVWTCGWNSNGQLGNGLTDGPYPDTSADRSTPMQVLGPGGTGFLTGIIAIAGGGYHTIALKNDGTVWAWGQNQYGALGDTTTIQRTTPVQVATGAGTYLTGITAIAGMGYDTIALKNDGTVWTWGLNSKGELGDTTTIQRNSPVQVATGAGVYLSGMVAIESSGGEATLALKNDGTVWAWGYNYTGQLGNGTTTNSSIPVHVVGPGGVGFLTGITAIAGGNLHSLALKNDGTVWGLGSDYYGELGDGTSGWPNNYRVTPIQVSGLSGIIAIAGGDGHTVALKNDGTVWTCGMNGFGQLGDGTTTNRLTPVQVPGFGLQSTAVSSNGVTVDAVGPVAGTLNITNATGAAITSQNWTNAIYVNWANWGAGSATYQVGVINYSTGAYVVPLTNYANTATSAAFMGLSLSDQTQYYAQINALDAVGNSTTLYSSRVNVDIPVGGTLNNGSGANVSFQSSTTQVFVNWSGFSDLLSGITQYQVGIGTTPGATNTVALTTYANTASSATLSGTFVVGTSYYVTIVATNGAGFTTTLNGSQLTIASAPTITSFTASPTSGTAPVSITFTSAIISSTSPLASVNYNFGDGSTLSATSSSAVSHNYTTAGTFYASVTAINGIGSSAPFSTAAIIISAPQTAPSGLTLTANATSGTAPFPVTFTFGSSSADISSYALSFGDAGAGVYQYVSSTAGSTTYTYTLAGSYTVYLNAVNTSGIGTTISYATPIVVTAPQAPTFSAAPAASPAGPYNVGQTVTFTATGAADADATDDSIYYQWSFGSSGVVDVSTAAHTGADTETFTYTTPGTYTVTCTISDSNGSGPRMSARATTTVTVAAPSPANIRVWLVQPKSNVSFYGNSLTINANAVPASSVNFSTLKFQYNADLTGVAPWTDAITSGSQATGEAAIFIWDTTNVSAGAYLIRVGVNDTNGFIHYSTDAGQQGFVNVTKAATISSADTVEQTITGGKEKIITISNSTGASAIIKWSGISCSVNSPAGATTLTAGGKLYMDTLSSNPAPGGTTAGVASGNSLTGFVDIHITDTTGVAGTAQITKPMSLVIGYTSTDGVTIDGTTISVSSLQLMHYNSAKATWETLPGQVLDTTHKTITSTASSLSPFALAGLAIAAAAGGGGAGGGAALGALAAVALCGTTGFDAIIALALVFWMSKYLRKVKVKSMVK